MIVRKGYKYDSNPAGNDNDTSHDGCVNESKEHC